MAGVIPYLATSLTTLFCAWDLNYSSAHATGWILSRESANTLLAVLEPLQIGYGAVVSSLTLILIVIFSNFYNQLLSFLGAIHWGLELAGYGGRHSYRRYGIGVLATLIAWPSLLLPYEWALSMQFMSFTIMYFIDSLVTRWGWTPRWYSTYRFVLTFFVGASIVISLVGRGEIGDKAELRKLPNAVDRIHNDPKGERSREKYETERAKVMDEITKKQKKQKKEEEAKQKEEEAKKKKESKDEGENDDDEKSEDKDEDNDSDSDSDSEDGGSDDKKDQKKE
jgi:hypothetical protein